MYHEQANEVGHVGTSLLFYIISKNARGSDICHTPWVQCHASCVQCHASWVQCHASWVTVFWVP